MDAFEDLYAKQVGFADYPKVSIDYNGMLSYAKQKGISVTELSEIEKDKFISVDIPLK